MDTPMFCPSFEAINERIAAARRAGRVEGLREAAGLLTDRMRAAASHGGSKGPFDTGYTTALVACRDALLARAEEVGRE